LDATVEEAACEPLDAATVPAVQPIAIAATATRKTAASSDFVGRLSVGLRVIGLLLGWGDRVWNRDGRTQLRRLDRGGGSRRSQFGPPGRISGARSGMGPP
jgi:hypothetical protein